MADNNQNQKVQHAVKYAREIAPIVSEGAEKGLNIEDLNIPAEFMEEAKADLESLKRGFIGNLKKGAEDLWNDVKSGAKAVSEYATDINDDLLDSLLEGREGKDVIESVKKDAQNVGVASLKKAKDGMDYVSSGEATVDFINDAGKAIENPQDAVKMKPFAVIDAAATMIPVGRVIKGAGKAISEGADMLLAARKKGKQLELPLDDAAKRHNGNGEIDLEETMDRKDSPFEKDLEIDDDSASMEMSDDSKKGQLGRIPLKKRQITEEDLPEIKPLREEDYPEITPRGPAKKPELDDLLKDFLEEDKPKSKVNIDDLIDDFMKFSSVEKPKDDGRLASFRNKLKEKFKSGRIPKDMQIDEVVAEDWLAKDKAKRASKPAEMRASGPDDFDIDEVTPSKFEPEPTKSMEKIDWADDADEVQDFSPVIKEVPKGSIEPERIIGSLGADAKYAQQMAERAVEKIQGTVGKPREQAMAAKQFAQAEKEMQLALDQIDENIAELESGLADVKAEIRSAQGAGRAPLERHTKMHDAAMDELDSFKNARSILMGKFAPLQKRYQELEMRAVSNSAE